jgi:hypothetical protein
VAIALADLRVIVPWLLAIVYLVILALQAYSMAARPARRALHPRHAQTRPAPLPPWS